MFRSALIKLTLLYLVIIMAISFFFSLNVYRISATEIDYNLNRQEMRIEQFGNMRPLPNGQSMMDLRAQQIAEGQQRILWQLVYTNIFIFIAGGGLSYILAKFSLRPIEESHEAQTRFTADASHELRSPLAAMKSEIEVALRDPKLTGEEAIQILRSNLEEVDRLKALSDGLLELSNGKDEFVLTQISVKDIVEAATVNVSKQVKAKKADIEFDIPSESTVRGNKDSLVELFTILFDNAIKYSKEKPVIRVETRKTGKHLEISVIDNGIGVSEDDILHIFERFFRSEPSRSKNNVEGYGLGLSIAEKIVSKNNGRIEATNNPSGGTIFKVFLRLG